jgi:hypothetical protein
MPFQELRLAVRALARRPGMSLVVVASLALAIGANSAVFSYVSFLLWAEIPAAEPERLVQVGFEDVDGFGAVPFPEAELLREDAEVLGGRLAAWGQFGAAVRLDAGSVHSWGQLVNGDFFEVFGVPPLLGHPLGPEDDRAGAEPVAVLGHRFWRRHLGSDPAAIGRTLRVNTYAFTVVGVMPEEFMGAALPVDLYLPLAHAEKVWTGNPGWRQDRSLRRISLLGRLAPGATHAQAQAAFDRVAERIEPLPGETRRRRLVVEPGGLVLDPVTRELLLAPARKLMAFVGLLLLLACANVANLLVAGITTRLREIGVRTALGAGRRQIVRQFLLESTLLALAGGALGLCVAFCGVRLIELAFATPTPGLGDWGQGWVDLKLDARVLGFTAALCLATGGLAGGLPALRASSRKHLTALLKEAAPSEARLVRRLGVREALVVVQVALSVWLLAGTGLILQSPLAGLRDLARVLDGRRADALLLGAGDRRGRPGPPGRRVPGLRRGGRRPARRGGGGPRLPPAALGLEPEHARAPPFEPGGEAGGAPGGGGPRLLRDAGAPPAPGPGLRTRGRQGPAAGGGGQRIAGQGAVARRGGAGTADRPAARRGRGGGGGRRGGGQPVREPQVRTGRREHAREEEAVGEQRDPEDRAVQRAAVEDVEELEHHHLRHGHGPRQVQVAGAPPASTRTSPASPAASTRPTPPSRSSSRRGEGPPRPAGRGGRAAAPARRARRRAPRPGGRW